MCTIGILRKTQAIEQLIRDNPGNLLVFIREFIARHFCQFEKFNAFLSFTILLISTDPCKV
ncbi:MAG: hypothetical protein JETT_1633 [Candidatus Jettenia ecosi]|uniref:Uncharacterized protein n=1 Tax=Candidatus Jettenia ecosi TaxID=2494326 RepID=A0A533QBG8_9BACT|nr:MAG: hypothetical protein JETT_1633 [Candidatus Jettenia ecosi]